MRAIRAGAVSRAQLRKYREVIAWWLSRFDTAEIAERLDLPEHLVARWVANFRDVMFEAAS
ncbi:hypothetical protein [Bradyrhizobium sp. STM 3557]|uniref:hypothetical protein n=1 Tax=Bradyrhizobium sp. STM 3557 TaxID=578920 RepID=UPI0038907E01